MSGNGMGLSSFLISRCVTLPSSKLSCQLILVLPLRTQSVAEALPGLGQKPLRQLAALLSDSKGAQGAIASSGICTGQLPVSPTRRAFTLPHPLLPLASSIPMAFLLYSPTCSFF